MTHRSRQGSASGFGNFDRRDGAGSVVSDKVAAMGLRECNAYAIQLRSLLDAAIAEPPPRGVETAEVERRVRLLQDALDEVEGRIGDLRAAKELAIQQRYLSTQQRRIEAEEEAERNRGVQDKQRQELVDEMRDAQVAYFRDRNMRVDEKAAQCREYGERAVVETVQRAAANEDRRKRNLEALEKERKRLQREMRMKDIAQQENIRETNRRKAAKEETERRERERAARVREQEVEAKLAALRESKKSKWVAKKTASRAKTTVVFKNGKAILETEAKDHNDLIEELEAKHKAQQARYADERDEQLLYLQQRALHRNMKEEKQQDNLVRLIDKRLNRGKEIVEHGREKKERAEQAKEAQATQYLEHGEQLRKDMAMHRRRARQLEIENEEAALRKNYRRWNHRAARIIAELNEAVEGEAARQEAAPGGSRYVSGNRDQRPSSGSSLRNTRLPSPSEFDV